MSRIPVSASVVGPSAVDVYDESGFLITGVRLGGVKILSAVVSGKNLALQLASGRVRVYAITDSGGVSLRYER